MREFVLPRGLTRDNAIERIATVLKALPQEAAWKVTVAEHKPKRSDDQNAYLWGVVYQTILKHGGELLAGWEDKDLHDYFLIEHFGSRTISGFGRTRHKPLRRSSKLNKQEFSDYLAFIQRRCAEIGIYIPDPDEKVS